MTMFTSLMALAVQIDNKTEEQKMQAITDAALSKSVDLSSMLPNLKECRVLLNDGKPLLQVNNGTVSFTHELSNAELTRIQQALGNTNLSDAEKQRTIASVINGIVVSQSSSLSRCRRTTSKDWRLSKTSRIPCNVDNSCSK